MPLCPNNPSLKRFGPYQIGWNQKRDYKALCCDCSEVTLRLFNFLSQNLSLVKSLFSGLGKSKGEVGIFWRRLLFNHLWGSFSCPVWERDSCIFLLLLLKFPKVENNQRFLFAVFFQNKAQNPMVNYFYT